MATEFDLFLIIKLYCRQINANYQLPTQEFYFFTFHGEKVGTYVIYFRSYINCHDILKILGQNLPFHFYSIGMNANPRPLLDRLLFCSYKNQLMVCSNPKRRNYTSRILHLVQPVDRV